MPHEQWRIIPGFEPYEASDHGRVRRDGRVLKPRLSKGYLRVHTSINNVKRNLGVHRAICLAFYGDMPGYLAAHNDGDPLNNQLSNLRWATPSENSRDRLLHGTAQTGSSNHKAKLNARQVLDILESSETGGELSRRHNISRAQVSRIRRGESWFHHDVTTLREEAERLAA